MIGGQSLKFLENITALFSRISTAISAGGLVVTTICLFLQVLFRIFTITATWTSEIARYAFMVTVFYGLAAATDRGLHLVITVFSDRLGKKVRPWYEVFTKITFAVFIGIITYGVFLTAETSIGNNQSFESFTNVKIAYLYYVIFVGLAFSTLNTVLSIFKDIGHLLKKGEIQA